MPVPMQATLLGDALAPPARAAAASSRRPAPPAAAGAAQWSSHTSRSPQAPPHRCCRRRRRRLLPPVAAQQGFDKDGKPDALASEFSAYLNEQGIPELLRDRRPTHLMSPLACIAAQLGALQRNDWPEQDAGVQTAFMFAMPQGAEELLAAQAPPQRVRSWGAREEWLSFADFSNALHSPPYAALLNCDSWRPCSPLVFPSRRHQDKAVAAVEVVSAAAAAAQQTQQQQDGRSSQRQRQRQQQQGGQQQPPSGQHHAAHQKRQTFTWCLERVRQGPLKNCWLTVGVRVGDYANV